DRYKEDPMYTTILEHPKEYKNFSISNGLIFLQLQDQKVLCITDIQINGRSTQEITIANAHLLLVHLGPQKTLDLLRDHVWWK
ncbi:hypothetical protein NEOLEDRAFT_1026818, partial [Neolentinus lepideus HHB14362 ss-1]